MIASPTPAAATRRIDEAKDQSSSGRARPISNRRSIRGAYGAAVIDEPPRPVDSKRTRGPRRSRPAQAAADDWSVLLLRSREGPSLSLRGQRGDRRKPPKGAR
jgi:hypothetical protein